MKECGAHKHGIPNYVCANIDNRTHNWKKWEENIVELSKTWDLERVTVTFRAIIQIEIFRL